MATLAEILADPNARAKLPAGMRNNNPGNIKFAGQRDAVGPSVNTDQGDPQAVYASPEAGMHAMYQLLLKKYDGGKTTPDALIAGNMGWTPGNHQAAANVARSAGIDPNADINFHDPASAARFMHGLIVQEHGNSGNLYPIQMIQSAISGAPVSTVPVVAAPGASQHMLDATPVAGQAHAFTPPTGQLSPDAAAAMFASAPTPGAAPFLPSGEDGSSMASLLSDSSDNLVQKIAQANYRPPEQKPVENLPVPELRQSPRTIAAPQLGATPDDYSGLAEVFQKLQGPGNRQIGSQFRPSRLG